MNSLVQSTLLQSLMIQNLNVVVHITTVQHVCIVRRSYCSVRFLYSLKSGNIFLNSSYDMKHVSASEVLFFVNLGRIQTLIT